jgi:hypothetical protein
VNRLEEDWVNGRIIRLNTIDQINKAYADSIGVETTPTFILFDASGKEQQRWVSTAPTLEELP